MAEVNRREFLGTVAAALGAGAWPGLAALAEGTTAMAERRGQLYYSDTGRVLLEHNEEVSRWRQARKRFEVPVDEPKGTVWLLVGEYEGNKAPLAVSINGQAAAVAPTGKGRGLHWESVPAPAGALRRGANEVVVSTASDLPATWILGAEPVSAARTSALSTDGGQTWLDRGLGVHGLTPAEYVVRLWVENAPPAPNAPCALIRERPDHPQLAALARHFKLADTVAGKTHTFDKVRALLTQTAFLWKVGQAPPGHGYNCPWDAFTIVGWMNAGKAQNGMRPVAYCVHFGIVMVQFCAALGIIARNVVMEDDIPECPSGHFTCEVWVPEWRRWVFVDPDHDEVFEADGEILSMAQLSDACLGGWLGKVKPLRGPAWGNDPRINTKELRRFERTQVFRRWGVYPRTDYLSRPDVHPVQHGASEYHETQFIWYADPRLARRPYHPNYTDDLKALYAEPVA